MATMLLLILVLAVPGELRQRGRPAALPDLSTLNTNKFQPVVRQQLEQAYTAAQANPMDADATGKLGMILDAYEQYESAEICYQRSHVLDPGSYRWLFYLGWVQAAQGKHEDAVAALREARRLNPDAVPVQLKLADSLLAIGKWEEGRDIYQAISMAHPESAEAQYGLGRVSASRGDLPAAEASYRKACELFPAYGAAHYALALLYRKLGQDTAAQQQFGLFEQNKTAVPPLNDPLRRDIFELNIGSAAHIRRGADLEQAGKFAEAIAEQDAALRAEPQAVQAHIRLISLYGRLGDYARATDHYRAAVDLDPNQADAHYNYGVLLLKQDQPHEAEKAFEHALQINPNYAEAYFNLGSVYEVQGRLTDALQQFSRAVENRPAYPAAHFHIGRILANQQNYDEAIRQLLKSLTPEDENTPRYLYALAATYARAGNLTDALRYGRAARAQAAARGQAELVASIEKDLRALEQASTTIKQR